MKTSPRLSSRIAGRLCLIAALSGISVRGQEAAVQLAPVVITATRVPESSDTVGTDVTAIAGAEVARQQLSTLSDALSGVPAAPVFATGRPGPRPRLSCGGPIRTRSCSWWTGSG